MKQEQEKLEKQLWEERLVIQKKHEEKLKKEIIKYANNPICFPLDQRCCRAKVIGIDLSEHDREASDSTPQLFST